jgi:hypothetical protein
MGLCGLSKVVLLLSLIVIAFETYLAGTSILIVVMNIIGTLLVVGITNWFCYNQSYSWISWGIVILSLIPVLAIPFILQYGESDPDLKQIIEEEIQIRNRT